MTHTKLDILVLLRECSDPRPPARTITRGAGISERGLRRLANQADLIALEEALKLKDKLSARVTAVTIGPKQLNDTLRLALSMGADRAIRVWDHGLDHGDVVADARVLAQAISILEPTLFFTGNRLLDRGDDPTAALASARLDRPCIGSAVALTIRKRGVEVLRKGDRGSRQELAVDFPCTVMFEEGETPRYPSVGDVTRALSAPIEIWDLSLLGLPFQAVGSIGSCLDTAEFGVPRPDPVRVVTPDASLPAFERIISLLSGGIKAREGKLYQKSADETVDALWQILRDEGLTPGTPI